MQKAARRQAKQEELKRLHRAQVCADRGTPHAGGNGIASPCTPRGPHSTEGEEARAEADRAFLSSKMTNSKCFSVMHYRGPVFEALSIEKKVHALSFLEAWV